MNVIVTGAAGFIGSEVCIRLLSEGCRVAGIDNFNPHYSRAVKENNIRNIEGQSFTFFNSDIRSEDALKNNFSDFRPEAVVHFAGEVGSRRSCAISSPYYQVNVIGTQNILNAAVEAGVKKIILASTSNIYESTGAELLSEDTSPVKPVTPYGVSKLSNEYQGMFTSYKYGTEVSVLRVFSAYGPGQRPDLAVHKFTGCIVRGEEIALFSGGGSSRDYVYCGDISKAVSKALQKTSGFRVYNVGSGKATTLTRLIEVIEKITGIRAKTRFIDPPPGHIKSGIADISRAAEEIGFLPEVEIETGIKNFYYWYKKNRRYSDVQEFNTAG